MTGPDELPPPSAERVEEALRDVTEQWTDGGRWCSTADAIVLALEVKRLRAEQEPPVEIQCPSCDATIRARMADTPAGHGSDADPPTTLLQAIDQIDAEAGGHGLLQPGAAFALGCLGCAADAGPGATAASIAVTLGRSDAVVERVVAHWRKTRPMAPTQEHGGRPVAEHFRTLWQLLDLLASGQPDPTPVDAWRHTLAESVKAHMFRLRQILRVEELLNRSDREMRQVIATYRSEGTIEPASLDRHDGKARVRTDEVRAALAPPPDGQPGSDPGSDEIVALRTALSEIGRHVQVFRDVDGPATADDYKRALNRIGGVVSRAHPEWSEPLPPAPPAVTVLGTVDPDDLAIANGIADAVTSQLRAALDNAGIPSQPEPHCQKCGVRAGDWRRDPSLSVTYFATSTLCVPCSHR